MKINLNLKKILKWLIILLLLLVILFFVIGSLLPQPPFKQIPIPEPQIQEMRKYLDNNQPMIEKRYTFYGLNGLGYYQKELEKEQQKPIEAQNPYLITFLKQRSQTQQEPTDFLPFVKNPFKEWRATDSGVPVFYNSTLSKGTVLDSPLNQYITLRCEEVLGRVWLYYTGPQYLLDEDKDYYIGDANLPYDPQKQISQRKQYHLHFNPVRNTLSVYTEKFNVK
ncbi:hypothetical protein ['Cynodon dactylon' phytoplasma]|uniref:hypothetical protein n=1 Tax='Cynodon dactylon' phytoplasma TaxID=295320 RepID=UPI001265BCFE|nr:hypothetical protein ['Cynodon dactylon' phytoplasma]KAB8121691.1 hypothetical protein F1741_02130 ['Cynodon dactylon' phytoplasma]